MIRFDKLIFFCGIIFIFKKEFEFYINEINYDCGCQNSYLKDNVKFEDIEIKKVKLSDKKFSLIESFIIIKIIFFKFIML